MRSRKQKLKWEQEFLVWFPHVLFVCFSFFLIYFDMLQMISGLWGANLIGMSFSIVMLGMLIFKESIRTKIII